MTSFQLHRRCFLCVYFAFFSCFSFNFLFIFNKSVIFKTLLILVDTHLLCFLRQMKISCNYHLLKSGPEKLFQWTTKYQWWTFLKHVRMKSQTILKLKILILRHKQVVNKSNWYIFQNILRSLFWNSHRKCFDHFTLFSYRVNLVVDLVVITWKVRDHSWVTVHRLMNIFYFYQSSVITVIR